VHGMLGSRSCFGFVSFYQYASNDCVSCLSCFVGFPDFYEKMNKTEELAGLLGGGVK
jgi:hypothetical protein